MNLHVRAFWRPKEGLPETDWEDACAFSEERGILAVADGASSSYRAHDWASTLVRGFVDMQPAPVDVSGFTRWFEEQARAWNKPGVVDEGHEWYTQAAASRGAAATFLGVQLLHRHDSHGPLLWHAVAVGDTCLFHLRSERLLSSFPLQQPADFGSTPALLASDPSHGDYGLQMLQFAEGELRTEDVILLASDAVAAWALRAAAEATSVWRVLASIDSRAFAGLVDDLRTTGAMENDDATLLRCRSGFRGRSRRKRARVFESGLHE